MKTKSNMQSKVAGVPKSIDTGKHDRIEWLKQLYAEWLEKRNFMLNSTKEIYLINELDDLNIEGYWDGF